MKHYGPEEVPVWGWFLIAIILLTQSSILYIQAKKIGKAPWLWGILGLVQFPVPSIIFMILWKKVWKRKYFKT